MHDVHGCPVFQVLGPVRFARRRFACCSQYYRGMFLKARCLAPPDNFFTILRSCFPFGVSAAAAAAAVAGGGGFGVPSPLASIALQLLLLLSPSDLLQGER